MYLRGVSESCYVRERQSPILIPGSDAEWLVLAFIGLKNSSEISWPKMPGKYFYLCCWNYYRSVISLIFFAARLDCTCIGGASCLWKPLEPWVPVEEVPISNQIQCSIAEQYFEIFITLAFLQVASVSLESNVCHVNINALCLIQMKC